MQKHGAKKEAVKNAVPNQVTSSVPAKPHLGFNEGLSGQKLVGPLLDQAEVLHHVVVLHVLRAAQQVVQNRPIASDLVEERPDT